jgi:signal transduction histidine kinase/CheY-like chemotaxis protein
MSIPRQMLFGTTDSRSGSHPIAFAVQFARNLAVQGLGLSMVVLMLLTVLPWPVVASWTIVALAVLLSEHQVMRRIAQGDGQATALAPILRTLATSLYAAAALALFRFGGEGQHLFGFALICASLVHVLMRFYRSPAVLAVCMAPHAVVLALFGLKLVRGEIQHGRPLDALAPGLTIALVAVQFWSVRAQLDAAWTELMTARREAEEREQAAETANRAKSQFLATMSHELRTPLNGVIGMAQVLLADEMPTIQRERVRIIRRSGEGLLAVLNDLLDLSKIEAGSLDLQIAEFDMEHLVRGVAAAYLPQASAKKLSFEFNVAEGVQGLHLGDAPRIRRALYTLCDNAVKFTETGGVSLRVEPANGEVAFVVSDTGIGISGEDMPRLFDGFYQADSSSTRRYGGAGVGLAICRRLTQFMGGQIRASSTLGQGSAFTLTLPLEPVQPHAPPPTAKEVPAMAQLRVLAAEDNLVNQLVLKTLLQPIGIAPTLVVNGREAVDAWESQTWDIVLMDIQMPEMGGVEATRAIRRREQETGRARTPIVAVTANAMTHQLAEYEAAGMDAVVPKPFDVGMLYGAMDSVIAQAAPAAFAAA